ncbi:MAG: amidohydrolase family protein [Pseudomonadota bacterium]
MPIVDTHMHVFDAVSALSASRLYTPAPATLKQYHDQVAALEVTHTVIVQPSVYGTDNRSTLGAVATDPTRYRAIIVVRSDISDADLFDLHIQGARGIRINPLFGAGVPAEEIIALSQRIAALGWHIQMLVDVGAYRDLGYVLAHVGAPLVFDHCGHCPMQNGGASPGFDLLCEAVASGRAWVKLSAPYRLSRGDGPPYEDVIEISATLLRANPNRCLWGSDWPHPAIQTPVPAPHDLMAHFEAICPDAGLRQTVLWENPKTLYGFEEEDAT